MRFKMTREFYIPKNATKVGDKLSDAVAYLYTNELGQPCARVFFGKQSKPFSACYYRDAAAREKSVTAAFARRREIGGRKQAERDKRKSFVNPYKVGDLFRRSWGYDQTNIDWYEVVEVNGKMLTVREIAQERIATGDMSGKTTPLPGEFLPKAEPKRCLAQDGCIKINNYAWAYYVKPTVVAGVPTYGTDYFSTYA